MGGMVKKKGERIGEKKRQVEHHIQPCTWRPHG